MWNCSSCGEQVEEEYDICWNCQADRSEATLEPKDIADSSKSQKLGGGASSNMADTLDKRYRDAYRVSDAAIAAGGIAKFLGIAIVLIGVATFLYGAVNSSEGAMLLGVAGTPVGLFLFIFGVIVSAQGQQLKATLDQTINSFAFLSDRERLEIMGLGGKTRKKELEEF